MYKQQSSPVISLFVVIMIMTSKLSLKTKKQKEKRTSFFSSYKQTPNHRKCLFLLNTCPLMYLSVKTNVSQSHMEAYAEQYFCLIQKAKSDTLGFQTLGRLSRSAGKSILCCVFIYSSCQDVNVLRLLALITKNAINYKGRRYPQDIVKQG